MSCCGSVLSGDRRLIHPSKDHSVRVNEIIVPGVIMFNDGTETEFCFGRSPAGVNVATAWKTRKTMLAIRQDRIGGTRKTIRNYDTNRRLQR